MSEIKTNIQRSEPVIHSQNKVIQNYAVQLKSAVVSTDHKKAILREMQLELTAQHYCRPEHRSNAYAVYPKLDCKVAEQYRKRVYRLQSLSVYRR